MAASYPTKPSIPISFPISELADLESGAYYKSFHYPFNRASVLLPESAAAGMPNCRRILVCHDMMGGYVDDKWVQGGHNAGAYAIWHWYLMDVFVYFFHNLVTIPPPCWTNAGHIHGVKTNIALDLLRDDDISAAIFAPGWVYENLPKADFKSNQNRWWGLVKKSWGILQNYPKVLPFYSNFDQPLLEEPVPFLDDPRENNLANMQVFIK